MGKNENRKKDRESYIEQRVDRKENELGETRRRKAETGETEERDRTEAKLAEKGDRTKKGDKNGQIGLKEDSK